MNKGGTTRKLVLVTVPFLLEEAMRKFENISYKQFKKDVCDSKELYDKIILPRRSTRKSAGYDIYSISEGVIHPNESMVVKTGVKVCMNDDEIFYIFDRSSLGFKYNVTLANSVGVIDSDITD